MFCSFQLFGIRRMTSMANRHNMSDQNREQLNTLNIAPYIQLVYPLIDKQRRMGGNAFRHCLETFSILLDYGIVDHILLKASVIHDLIEDEDGFDQNRILQLEDGKAVLELVLEVSRKKDESKPKFLARINNQGSFNAKTLKLADRIANLISMGQVIDLKFIERYLKETETHIMPWAGTINKYMVLELNDLIISRKALLNKCP